MSLYFSRSTRRKPDRPSRPFRLCRTSWSPRTSRIRRSPRTPGPPGYCDSSQCVGIPYNGQGYGGQYPPEPDTRVAPVPEEEELSQNQRRKRSLSRKASSRPTS
ncbi:collagen alpha-1(XII) chain-like [Micropterus salmoides]|uniref:collagen alpha-1(XII) chain-like n=1 Tax=Micropterus salmoides TaxID=27706 RepID=UPI0018EC2136|nr:collagen alpha-1(XII) chain-like [Micropterus salmoides]